MTNEPAFQIGDMVKHKQTERNLGIGLIVEKAVLARDAFAIHWIEHDFVSKYIGAEYLMKVS